ncbi:tetratricopeptide repeat protein [Oceanispirochaeta crateris]|nr:tetratricopeptide repeat protein [Oceanispirochaeta crateris]
MSSPAEENKYRRRLIQNAVLLFFLGSVLSLVLLFIPSEDYFQYYLNQSDLFLDEKNYADMELQLKKATRHAKTKDQWFSIFKRSYLASVEQDDFEYFNILVSNSRKFLKGGADHEALYTASLIWTNQYEKASASLYAIQQDKYKTLIAESLLSYDVYRNYNLNNMTPLEFIKDKIRYQEDPVFFESVGTKADNADLLYNAALLSMFEGDYDRSASILNRLPGNKINPYLLGVLHYDLGQYQQAYDAYQAQSIVDDVKGNQRFTIHQQIGDLAYMGGDKDEALRAYQKALDINPEGSWKSYRNIARINLDKGYSNRARSVLKEGMTLFRDNVQLLGDYVHYFHSSYPVEVKNALDSYISGFPDLTEPHLLQIRYFPQQQSAVQYQSKIWDLFNKDHKSEDVTRFLLWYLSGVGDIESMEIVLQRYEDSGESPFWFYFYESIIELFRGNIEKAVSNMNVAYSLDPQWYLSYNKAVLEIFKGNILIAEDLLLQAYDDLTVQSSVFDQRSYLSKINFARATILVEKKEFDEAIELLQEALELDRNNIRAATLLNKIK